MAHTRAEIVAALLFIAGMTLIGGAVIWLGFAIHPALGVISVGIFTAMAGLFLFRGEVNKRG